MGPTSRRRFAWLATCAVLCFVLIVLGGVVRLSRAGLSITEWNPVTGVIPPLGDEAWREAFDRYRATPEYTQFNAGMLLPAFREIFLLEYAHRLLARLTGLVLVLPLAYWLLRRQMTFRAARPILFVFAGGAVQGGIGWLMVKSGLVDVPHVSPVRLATHLAVGIALFASLVWMLAAERGPGPAPASNRLARRSGVAVLVVALVTVIWGGLMAGTHAGHVFPTFPKMGDAWLPVDLATLPATCVTDAVAIHFLHRFLALVLGVACVAFAFFARAASPRARLLSSLALVAFALQATLGALVVLEHVPITLASLHQANAVVLVGLLTAAVEELWRGAGVLPTS